MSASLIYKLSAFFALIGLGVSAYLFYIYVFSLPLPCGNHGCDIVRQSKYSHIFSIPVPFYGILFYLSVLSASVASLVLKNNKQAQKALLLFTAVGFLFSLYFTALELFVIKAICLWCVVSAIISTILFALSLSRQLLTSFIAHSNDHTDTV